MTERRRLFYFIHIHYLISYFVSRRKQSLTHRRLADAELPRDLCRRFSVEIKRNRDVSVRTRKERYRAEYIFDILLVAVVVFLVGYARQKLARVALVRALTLRTPLFRIFRVDVLRNAPDKRLGVVDLAVRFRLFHNFKRDVGRKIFRFVRIVRSRVAKAE